MAAVVATIATTTAAAITAAAARVGVAVAGAAIVAAVVVAAVAVVAAIRVHTAAVVVEADVAVTTTHDGETTATTRVVAVAAQAGTELLVRVRMYVCVSFFFSVFFCMCICVLVSLQFLLFFSYSILAPVVLGITLLFFLTLFFSFFTLLCSDGLSLGEGVKMYFVFPSSCLVSEVCLFLCISYCSLFFSSPLFLLCFYLTCKQRETVLKFMDNSNNKKSQDKNKS